MRISRHWRLNSQRYALQGVVCSNCAANIFPPREVCPYCEAKEETAYTPDLRVAEHVLPVNVALEPAAR